MHVSYDELIIIISIIITYIIVYLRTTFEGTFETYEFVSFLVRSFTFLVDRELVNHNWEEGVWLCVCNM